MAITVKKKQPVTLKATEATGAASPQPAPAPIVSMPAPVQEKGPSYTLYAILGLFGVLFFAVVVVLQLVEMKDYDKPPAAFPALHGPTSAS